MPPSRADYAVRLVDTAGEADMSVAVVGDQVVDLTGAADGDVLTVQADGTVAPEPPSGGGGDIVTVASTGVEATDTAALQAAHDALPAGGGTIRLDQGPYVLAGDSVNFTKPVRLVGVDGPNGANIAVGGSFLTTGSIIECASATGVAIKVDADGCVFEHLALFNTAASTPTAGAGIQIATFGKSTRMADCTIVGFWTNFEFVNGYEWFIERCHFFDFVQYGVRINDLTEPDGGDGTISDSFIISGPNNVAPACGIFWESGGGLKVVSCKVNCRIPSKITVGINFAVANGIATSVAIVDGCSIENCDYGVIFQTAGPPNTGTFGKTAVTGCEFYCLVACVAWSAGATNRIVDGVAVGNVGRGQGVGSTFFYVRNIAGLTLVGNHVEIGTTALQVDTGVTHLFIDERFQFTTAARPAATIMRAGSSYFDTTLNRPLWSDGTDWVQPGVGELATHIADTSDAHDASAISFTPTGTIGATDVQAAIAEVASEAGGGSGSIATAKSQRTAGNVAIQSATMVDVDTATDLTIAAVAGDVLELSVSCFWDIDGGAGSQWSAMDAVTRVSGADTNYVSGQGVNGTGVPGWLTNAGSLVATSGGWLYTVQAGDVSGGNVTLRLKARTGDAVVGRTVRANSGQPLVFMVKNLG